MTNELAVTNNSLFPTANEIASMKDLGAMAIKSGFLPQSIKTPEQAVIILLKGKELGLPPMQSFSSIAVVNGKPTISAELMLNLIYRNVPGAKVDFIETNARTCIIEAARPGGKPVKFEFSLADAKTAGLLGKGPWVTYPAAMLRARCISSMARAVFSDALGGAVYTAEEIEDEAPSGVVVISDKVAALNAKLGLSKPEEKEVVAETAEIPPANPVSNEPDWGKDISSGVSAPELPMKDDSPGSYVVMIGGNKGKRLDQCDDASLDRTRNFLHAEQKKGPITPSALDFLAATAHYLNWKNGAVMGDVP